MAIEPLVELEAAKRRLNVYHDDQDDDISGAVLQATAIVFDYTKKVSIEGLTEIQVMCLQSACLQMLRFIWNGEDSEGVKYTPGDGYLPRAVTSILHRQRLPTIA